jgi:hypothetical protein
MSIGCRASKIFDTRELNECAASTDSRNERVDGKVGQINNGVALEPESVNCCDPWPATNRHPHAPSGLTRSIGCLPFKIPFVPSIGSRVHILGPAISGNFQ